MAGFIIIIPGIVMFALFIMYLFGLGIFGGMSLIDTIKRYPKESITCFILGWLIANIIYAFLYEYTFIFYTGYVFCFMLYLIIWVVAIFLLYKAFKDTLIKNKDGLAFSTVFGILLTIIIGKVFLYSINLSLYEFKWIDPFTNIVALIIIGILYFAYSQVKDNKKVKEIIQNRNFSLVLYLLTVLYIALLFLVHLGFVQIY